MNIAFAKNFDDIKQNMELWTAAPQNLVFATTDGDIHYILACGKLPKRNIGHTGKYPVPGTGEVFSSFLVNF